MEKQSKIWSIFILIEGLLLIAVGLLNLYLFRSGHYQEMISTDFVTACIIAFLSVTAVISGTYLLFYRQGAVKEIEKFSKRQELSKIMVYFGGLLSIIIGMLMVSFSTFYFFYLRPSWLSSLGLLTIMVISFLFIYPGLLASIFFNETMTEWITESFEEKKKQPGN